MQVYDSSSFQKSFQMEQSLLSNKKIESEKISMNNDYESLLIKSNDSQFQKLNTEPIQIESRLNNMGHLNQNLNYSLRQSKTNYSNFPFYNKEYENNKNVLGSILNSNGEFNIHSPSQKKKIEKEFEIIKRENKIHNLDDEDFNGNNLKSYVISSFIKCIKELEDIDSDFINLSLNNQANQLIDFFENDSLKIRLGAIFILYNLLKKFWDSFDTIEKNHILDKILVILKEKYDRQEELFLMSCFNICSLYGSNEKLIININYLSIFMTDFNHPFLQRACFICLMNIGKEGLKLLINLASKDIYEDFQNYILNSLIQTPHIQKIVIVRALINELTSYDINRKLEALSALNRLYDLNQDEFLLKKICEKFRDESLKNYKIYIASVIRGCGKIGEEILLRELETNNNFNTREEICKVLGYRLLENPNYLEIYLDRESRMNTQNLPGKFCQYYGKISPIFGNNENSLLIQNDKNEEENNNKNNDLCDLSFDYNEYNDNNNNNNANNKINENSLHVNKHDFLCSLIRMLDFDYNHENPQIVKKGKKLNVFDEIILSETKSNLFQNYYNLIKQYQSIETSKEKIENLQFSHLNPEINKPYLPISKNIINSLCNHLKDISIKVRIQSALSLGKISLPESLTSINYLINTLNNENDVNLKSICLWSIGRSLEPSKTYLIPLLLNYVNNPMWKIKRSALYSLSKFGVIASDKALPILIKNLMDVPINKQLFAEAIISMGDKGERELLSLMNIDDDNYKLKGAIIKSFAFVNMKSRNIDFIIECLFNACKSFSNFIRKNALFTINYLSNKFNNNSKSSNRNIIHLNENNLIPFYYENLNDKDKEIQKFCINSLKNFGAKGELIFIEGLMKDKNYIVRANCGIGLCECGVHTLRTLISRGMFDQNENVRNTIEKNILRKFKVENVIQYYLKNNQLGSLKICLEEFIEKNPNFINQNFGNFCEKIINEANEYLFNSEEF